MAEVRMRLQGWRSPAGITLAGFALVGGFALLREHFGHVLGALPYLLLLACPLMHLFMHRGHAGHGRPDDPAPAEPRERGRAAGAR
ncbi:MAG: DUF2933 domain-containing protein [Acetobacteraceae bacterium]|nr:DUF2933 domain-containing protein [Acetobacteraceae bacterium]